MEFSILPLGELYDVASGLSKSAKEFGNGGSPFLSFKTIFCNYFVPDEIPDVANTTEKEQQKCSVCAGDVFLTRTSETMDELGMSSVALKDYPQATFNGFSKRLRLKKNVHVRVYPKYIGYYLRSDEFRNQITCMSSMSTRASLNIEMINRLTVRIPDYDTQVKIGDFLFSLDAKRTLNIQINRNLSEQVQAVYNEKFGSREQSFTFADYPVRIFSGGTPSTKNSEYWGGDIPWLSSGETGRSFVLDTEKRITEEGVNNSSTKWADKYDVVTASAGQGHTRGQTSMLLLDTCINQSVIVTHAEKKYMPLFFCNLSSRYEELRALSDGTSTRGSLTTKIIAKLSMPVISEDEFEEFAASAWPIIDLIETNLKENQRLQKMRDGLLPKLMSGELDVSELKI